MTKVLFIGWDAADWKAIHPLMDAGRMPNLQRLVESGAMGRAATLHPPLSPMVWTSIATGKRPFRHGIHGFSEPTPDGNGVRPISNLSRTSKAVWNILNQNGKRSVVVGWWPSHPAEPINGVMVSDHYHRANRPLDEDWPLLPRAVHPPELHDTLAELRLHPQELVGAMLLPFVPALDKIDQKTDRRFSSLCKTIAECVSTHSAATWLVEHQDWDFFAVYYDAIDHFCHGFMRYHPPRLPWVSEEDFERYSHVVSTAYELHDRMLGTLLAKARAAAGDDLHVMLMSDHGFHPDHLRPRLIPDIPAGPAIEHSPFGVFVLAGPGIKRDVPLSGVSVLDATPTLLTLFGLPVGEDMDGRVVAGAFEQPPPARTIASWEDVAGEDGRHPPHTRLDPVAAAEALEQLAALGYIDKPGGNIAEYIEQTVRELRFNLMEAYQDANRHAEALAIARDLCRRDPDEQRFAVRRFAACQALGLTTEMREIVDDLQGRRRAVWQESLARMQGFLDLVKQRVEAQGEIAPEALEREIRYELDPQAQPDEPREFVLTPEERQDMLTWRGLRRFQPAMADYLEAQTLTAEKRWLEAFAVLQRVPSEQLARPAILLLFANLHWRLGRPNQAETMYRSALEIDPDNANASLGLARLALRRRDFVGAAEYATRCVGQFHFFPMAHFLLGVAWERLGDAAGAARSYRTALWQNPHFPQAHLRLGRLLKSRLGDPAAAEEHFRYFREMRNAPKLAPASAPIDAHPAVVPQPVPQPESLPPLGDDVLIVSGLPRSGTSMVMQMLSAGGMPILTDRRREADEDNPNGYFELEAIKANAGDPAVIAEARGKAVKIVAPLVCRVPNRYRYRVILMERDLDEVLESQARMISRRAEPLHDSPERRVRLRREYTRLMEQTRQVLAARPDVHVLTVRYADVVGEPAEVAKRIARFAGDGIDVARMTDAVDPLLHRNRSGGTSPAISAGSGT